MSIENHLSTVPASEKSIDTSEKDDAITNEVFASIEADQEQSKKISAEVFARIEADQKQSKQAGAEILASIMADYAKPDTNVNETLKPATQISKKDMEPISLKQRLQNFFTGK